MTTTAGTSGDLTAGTGANPGLTDDNYADLLVARLRVTAAQTANLAPRTKDLETVATYTPYEADYLSTHVRDHLQPIRLAVLTEFVDDIREDTLDLIAATFTFQGFNVKSCRAHILANHGVDSIFLALMVYLERGTKIDKMKRSISDDGRAKLVALINKMSIKDTSRGTDFRTITFGRIAACFPELIATILKKRPQLVKTYGCANGLAGYLMFPQAASIIRLDDMETYKRWSHWSDRFTHVISGNSLSTFGDVVVSSTRDYKGLIWRSDLYSNSERIRILEKLEE